jgi:hypothetical protein
LPHRAPFSLQEVQVRKDYLRVFKLLVPFLVLMQACVVLLLLLIRAALQRTNAAVVAPVLSGSGLLDSCGVFVPM